MLFFVHLHSSENRTTEIRMSQGPAVYELSLNDFKDGVNDLDCGGKPVFFFLDF